jgi:hypothetical protein
MRCKSEAYGLKDSTASVPRSLRKAINRFPELSAPQTLSASGTCAQFLLGRFPPNLIERSGY